jgi:hypothetical protein
MTASDIIELFGGITALSTLSGVPTSTIHSWRHKNQIPAWRQPQLLALAVANGIELSTADFPERIAA